MLLRLGPFDFTPRWFTTVVALVLLVVLVRLGFWQLSQARVKVSMQALESARAEAPPVSVESVRAGPHAARFTRIEARGRYLAARQFLLDNRTHRRRAGYHVISPLELTGDGRVVLVNRGWVPVGGDRTRVPDIAVGDAERVVRGRLTVAYPDAFILGEAGYAGERWPRVVQRLEPMTIGALLERAVLEHVVRLDPVERDGYVREWPAHGGISAARHRGYAVQWFALALALIVIYVVVNVRRRTEAVHD